MSSIMFLLYSTCALVPDENDLMIERLYKKFNKDGNAFILVPPEPDLSEIKDYCSLTLPSYEKTKYGYMIMPDNQNGAGPIFFSIIKKQKTCFTS